MNKRASQIDGFLARCDLQTWKRTALASDASSRRYLRLTSPQGESVILMDAPPELDKSSGDFIKIAKALNSQGFCVPKIMDSDLEQGLLLISDLGRTSLAEALDKNSESLITFFKDVCDVIVGLEKLRIPNLNELTPTRAGEMVGISAHSYANKPEIASELCDVVQELFALHCTKADCFSLRDLHVENVIWRNGQTAIERCGLLDFQDALYTPQGYDLVSLLRDVRRDIPQTKVSEIKNYYVKSVNPDYDFDLRFACLSVQRNLRILGILFELVQKQQKPKYKPFIARTWRLLNDDMEHPKLTKLRNFVHAHFPEPDEALKNCGPSK